MKYYLLDVFTNKRFGGNQLAVFPNADLLADAEMQAIAAELNLSETTFIQAARSKACDCTVRIFTPKQELPMAGHPTVGTAWTILRNDLLQPRNSDHLFFDEGVGPIRVDFTMPHDARPAGIVMHQPLPTFGESLDKEVIARILSLETSDIDEQCPVRVVSCGVPLVVVPLTSLAAARRTQVRLDLLEEHLEDIPCHEFLVFTRETEASETDVHCRFFAPRLGIAEDPATGGAHGPLGSYLVKYGLSDGNHIISEQGIEMGRPSRIKVGIQSKGDDVTSVLVGGECVEVGEGELYIDREGGERL